MIFTNNFQNDLTTIDVQSDGKGPEAIKTIVNVYQTLKTRQRIGFL